MELLQQPNNLNATVAERAVLPPSAGQQFGLAAQNAVDRARSQKQPFASDAEKQAILRASLELAQSIQDDAPERVTLSKAQHQMRWNMIHGRIRPPGS